MKKEQTADKMAHMPISKLMLTMGIPMILSMALQAVYNIVDSYFVSGISSGGEAALNALTLAFPVQMLMVAVGIGTGVGAGALVSQCIGRGDRNSASKVAGNALFLAGLIYLLFLGFGVVGAAPYIRSQTSDPAAAEMGVAYLKICCIGSFGIVFFSIYEKLLQATGRSVFSTAAQVAGALANMILDPILIYGWLGLPALGIEGAAYATVIGQILSLVLAAVFHYTKNREIEPSLKWLKPEGRTLLQIYAIGLPAIIAQALMSVMTYCVNLIFGRISDSVVTAYGLYYKIQQFVLFMAFGLRDAITPIVSYNYGRGDKKRIHESIRWGMIYTLTLMAAGLAVLEVFAEPLAGMFALSEETGRLCVLAIRIVSAGFLFAGANIAFQGVFQALNCGAQSLVISLLRQLVPVLPLALLFTMLPNAESTVWLAFPVSELVAAVVAVCIMRSVKRKKIDSL